MKTIIRQVTASLVSTLAVLLIGLGAPQPARADMPVTDAEKNEAIAVNTQDGASLFRLAFSIVQVADGTVDQENLAVAYASCTDCKTVALAFQVVIVIGDANYVAPVNQAGAINDKCTECLTFASATQIVIGVDGPVKLTPDGIRRMALLVRRMAELERTMDQMTASQLAAEVSGIEQELISILDEELVPIDWRPGLDGREENKSTSTTTSAVPGSTTTTVTSTAPTTTAVTPTTFSPTTTVTTTPTAPDTTIATG